MNAGTSTWVGTSSKLSGGGYLIVDDYALANCREAVNDYRAEHGVNEEIEKIDWTGVFWRKSG